MTQVEPVSVPGAGACRLRSAVDSGLARLGERAAYHKIGSGLETELSLTGWELRGLGVDLAARLLEQPRPLRRVAIVTPAGAEFLVALLAGIYAGLECVAPPFPTPGPTRKRFEKIMMQCQPDGLLALEADIPALREALSTIGLPDVAILPIALERSGRDADAVLAGLPDGQCRILQHTSGTSGTPRAVVLTGANVAANAQFVRRSWRFSTEDSMLTWLPHHHDMGLFGCLLTPVIVGFPIHQMSSFTFLKRPSRWMAAMSRTGATVTGGPAFAMRLAMKASDPVEDLDLGAVHMVFCGSEPIPPNLLQEFAAHFTPAGLSPAAPFACFGLAESTLYVAGRPGSAPTPACPLFEDVAHAVRVVDPETGVAVEEGEEGEVWVAGPSVASSYLDAPEESAATFGGRLVGDPNADRRWLRTGDLGRLRDGALSVSGRIKDMIIANGANVPATEIEWTATAAEPALEAMAASCFAYGPLEEGRAALVLEIERRAAGALDPEAIRRRIRAAVRSAHGVDLNAILFVRRGVLPRTTSGKVRRGEVRQQFIKDELMDIVSIADNASVSTTEPGRRK